MSLGGAPPGGLKAASCMSQALPVWPAVASYGPAAAPISSAVRLPYLRERILNPRAGRRVLPFDSPPANRSSPALEAASMPLSIVGEEPVAATAVSSGDVGSSPEYSCTYRAPRALIALANWAVTVSLPLAMLPA